MTREQLEFKASIGVGRPLKSGEHVHHIDGDKKNNNIENLHVCKSNSEHSKIHSQLESLAFKLIKLGVIQFSKKEARYYISPLLEIGLQEKALGLDDVQIKQVVNQVNSRLDVDISSEVIKGVRLDVPIFAANMSTVTNASFCNQLQQLGALGVLHRAWPNQQDYIDEVNKLEGKWRAASVGVGKNQFDLAKKLVNSGINIIFLDIAHGYSQQAIDLAEKIKKELGVKIVVGNTTNLEMLYEVYKFADALKIGIGSGSACITKNMTGCHMPQFTAVNQFKEKSKTFGIPIISDGGINEPKHFTVAIGAGANSVMMGRVFAACPESAAPVLEKGKKLYAGMASEWVQNEWRGGLKPGTCAEGITLELDIGPGVATVIETYAGALRSGITYAGGWDIKSFQENVEFIRV